MVASIGVHALPPLLFGGIRFVCAGILLGLTTLALGNRFRLDATEWRHMFVVAVGNVFIANGGTNSPCSTWRPTRPPSSMPPRRCG